MCDGPVMSRLEPICLVAAAGSITHPLLLFLVCDVNDLIAVCLDSFLLLSLFF